MLRIRDVRGNFYMNYLKITFEILKVPLGISNNILHFLVEKVTFFFNTLQYFISIHHSNTLFGFFSEIDE